MMKNQSWWPLDAASLDIIKDAMQLMIQNNDWDINSLVYNFREAFAPIALGFTQEWVQVAEVIKMFKEELLEEDDMLYDVEKAIFYGTASIIYPRPKWKEKKVFANIQDLMEWLNFLFMVMGKRFYDYTIKKRLQWKIASLKAMKDIIRKTDNAYLYRGMSIENKEEMIEDMTQARIEMLQNAKERVIKESWITEDDFDKQIEDVIENEKNKK